MAKEYVHELNREVQAIAGWYILDKEERLKHRGKEFLYVVGNACVDASCCGSGGCYYAVVPGSILSWKSGTNEQGLPVSMVEPVREEETKKELQRWISKKERVDQVQFW